MKIRTIVCVMLLAASVQVLAEESRFQIDPVHSSLQFKIRHFYSTFVGRFNSFSGEIVTDMEKRTVVSVNAEVDVLSIDTANKDREKHLLSADFFESDKYPKATFVSSSVVKGEGDAGTVTGKLTIRGITKEITFSGRFVGYGEDPQKNRRIGFHATATINRGDFGIKWNVPNPNGASMLGDEVELELNLQAKEVQNEKAQE